MQLDSDAKMFTISSTITLSDPGMYGIQSVLIKKHVWPDRNSVMRGALLHDAENGYTYFVTEADLARYTEPQLTPDTEGQRR